MEKSNMGSLSKRNEDPRELTKVGPEAPPSWLTEYQDDLSIKDLSGHRVLPRLKIVQAMSSQDLKDQFGEGSIIITPGKGLVCRNKEGFQFVPVFFFSEYVKWADRRDKISLMIMEKTFDPTSKLAAKCANPKYRIESYGNGFEARYAEHLNFAGFVYGEHPLSGAPAVLCFARGEYATGQAYISSIHLRRISSKVAPLWSGVWEMHPGFRERGDRRWWGIDFNNPSVPFIQEGEAAFFREQQVQLKKEFEDHRLMVDHSDVDEETVDSDSAEL